MNAIEDKSLAAEPTFDLYAFEPSEKRIRFISRQMRSGLAESLRYIFEQTQEEFELPADRIREFLSQLEKNPVSPQAFCIYHDAVQAIEEEKFDHAADLLREIIQLKPHPGGPLIIELPDPKNSVAGGRYARFIDADSTASFAIFPPTSLAAENCRTQIADAFALMEAGDPDLAAEIRALILEIVLAAGTEDPKAMTFDGASAFMLWGAIMINANRRDGEVGMVQMLAHESAHVLLFGLCTDEPLVENSPDELFPSPLRVDPRPMEGIYHATFVTARMHRAVRRLIESKILSPASLEKAQKDLDENARLFKKGIETVNRHGKLSSRGAALMQGASDYMATA